MPPWASIDAFLSLTKWGKAYADMPLGTDPELFSMLQQFLKGKLDTFPPDFIPPGHNNPNYKPPNRGIAVVVYGLVSLAIAVVVVGIRLIIKSLRAGGGRVIFRGDSDDPNEKGRRNWEGRSDWEWWRPWKRWGLRFGRVGADDWAMVIAVILLAGYTTLNVLTATKGGMGKHVYDVSLNSVRFLLKANFAHTILYLTLSLFIKLSILLFYLKLFPLTMTKMRYTIYGLITCFCIYTIVGILVLTFVCNPVKAFWTLELRVTDTCPEQEELENTYRSILGIHIGGDFLVLLLPIKLVSGLNLPKRQKAILVCLFCAGGLACFASILRLYYFPRINASLDVTWNVTEIALWGQVEASIAVICASAPALKPLFSALNKRSSSPGSNSSIAPFNHPPDPSPVCGHSRNLSSVSGIGQISSHNTPSTTIREPRRLSPLFMDPYSASLAEIDNIDIDEYMEEYGDDLESNRSNGFRTRPEIEDITGIKVEEFRNSNTPTTTATTTTGQGFIQQQIPPENYLRPPPAQQQRSYISPYSGQGKNTPPPDTYKPLPPLPPETLYCQHHIAYESSEQTEQSSTHGISSSTTTLDSHPDPEPVQPYVRSSIADSARWSSTPDFTGLDAPHSENPWWR